MAKKMVREDSKRSQKKSSAKATDPFSKTKKLKKNDSEKLPNEEQEDKAMPIVEAVHKPAKRQVAADDKGNVELGSMVCEDSKPSHKKRPAKATDSFSKIKKFKKNDPERLENEEQEALSFQYNLFKDKDKTMPTVKAVHKRAKQQAAAADKCSVELGSPMEQLDWFFSAFQDATRTKLSSLELQEIPENSMVELSNTMDHNIQNLTKHVKTIFGSSWEEVLCEGNLVEGNAEPGCPAILIICSSAVRCVEILRGLKTLTTKCHAAKLFAKHIKIEEQVSILKERVNIAGGTPSRIKKLIEIDALKLSRLSVLMLDMHKDAKGLTLFNVPQVSNEFWELYKAHFHQQVMLSKVRICLY